MIVCDLTKAAIECIASEEADAFVFATVGACVALLFGVALFWLSNGIAD